MVFQCMNIHQVPREVLKTEASGLGFQHLPQDLANVNAWKTCLIPVLYKCHDFAVLMQHCIDIMCPLGNGPYSVRQ